MLLIAIAFSIIACGNTLFGLLITPASRTLGEMSYSIYLLHSILLFVTFNFMVGSVEPHALSPLAHWFVIVGITPILVSTCFVTFMLIENPAMRSTEHVTNWVRSRLTSPQKTSS